MKITQTFTGISPETPIKLSILSAALHMPKYQLLDLMVETLWEEKQDLVTTTVAQQKVSKKAKKILNDLRAT